MREVIELKHGRRVHGGGPNMGKGLAERRTRQRMLAK